MGESRLEALKEGERREGDHRWEAGAMECVGDEVREGARDIYRS